MSLSGSAFLDNTEQIGRIDCVGQSVPCGDGDFAIGVYLRAGQVDAIGQTTQPMVDVSRQRNEGPGTRGVTPSQRPDGLLGEGPRLRFHDQISVKR